MDPTKPARHSSQLNPVSLSCTSCRLRKVKCDKAQPCSACLRSGIECVFPPRLRLPRGRQGRPKARGDELSSRLSRLESLIGRLGGESAILTAAQNQEASVGDSAKYHPTAQQSIPKSYLEDSPSDSLKRRNFEPVVKADGGRYLSSDFWTVLSSEVDGLRLLLNEPSDDEEEVLDTPSSSSSKSKGFPDTLFIFKSNSEVTELRSLYPSSRQLMVLCDVYFTRVDPVFKILHKPTVKANILAAADGVENVARGGGQEALMFAMLMAAVTSLSEEECMKCLRKDKQRLLIQYKYATEAALANAEFLNSMELVTLQAYVIYLICLRCHSENRTVWALTSLAVRIAHSLDLHRDGNGSGFSPFEAEMRRRTWWQITVLDVRCSEDRGTDTVIVENSFNTEMPSNVNDEDIDPNNTNKVVERVGGTEMTFCRITHEASKLVRRMLLVQQQHYDDSPETKILNQQKKAQLIRESTLHFETEYLNHCDVTIPRFWFAVSIGRLILLKMWLLLHYPYLTYRMSARSEVSRESVLRNAVSILDLTEKIERHEFARDWIWMSSTYVQWHPLAVALAELCVQTRGSLVEYSWPIVETAYATWGSRVADSDKGTLWRPVKKLLGKAKAARLRDADVSNSQALTGELQMSDPSSLVSANSAPWNLASMTLQSNSMGTSFQVPGQPTPPSLPFSPLAGLETYHLDVPDSIMTQDIDQVDWGNWDEFLASAWDGSDAPQAGSLPWTSPFGL